MTTDELIEILKRYPGMPVFTYDMYTGTQDGQEHGEPDVQTATLHPCIHSGRKSLFDISEAYGKFRFLSSEPDGEPFEAVVIYAGEGRDKQST